MVKNISNKIEFGKLRKAIEQMVSIPEKEWLYATQYIHRRNYKKGEFLIQAGETINHFFFINKGLVRFFYITEPGKEFNKHFAKENDFAGSYVSTILNYPCPYFIQAIEKTETCILTKQLLQELYDRHPVWERIGRIKAERLAIQKEFREKEFLLDTAETRYRRFLKEFPDLTDRIPQYYIASYLGITDVALSRIRKKMKPINSG